MKLFTHLTQCYAQGGLVIDIGWEGSWAAIDTAIETLLSRTKGGKCVLHVQEG